MALVTYHPERPLSWRLFQGVVNNSKDDGEQAPRWRHRDQTPVTNYRRRFFTKKETWLQREKIENRSMKLATYLARLLFQTNTFGKERMLKLSLSRLDQFKFGAFLSHLILNTRFNSFNISSPLSINPIDVSSEVSHTSPFKFLPFAATYYQLPLYQFYHTSWTSKPVKAPPKSTSKSISLPGSISPLRILISSSSVRLLKYLERSGISEKIRNKMIRIELLERFVSVVARKGQWSGSITLAAHLYMCSTRSTRRKY